MSRSYQQFCGLARALDVVGERWTLLIVRELLVGPARYGELAAALPGIASNLLADRLRGLVAAGVVEKRLDDEANGVVYALTPWGLELRDAVGALVRWSTPLMSPGRGDDAFDGRWLVVALGALLKDRRSASPVTVDLQTPHVTVSVRIDDDGPHVALAAAPAADTVLRADPDVVLGLAAGALSVEEAVARGEVRGRLAPLRQVFEPATRQPARGGR